MERPHPPESMFDIVNATTHHQYVAAPELTAWAMDSFINGNGELVNEEHLHLKQAVIGCLWTTEPNAKQGRSVMGQACMPENMLKGDAWKRGREVFQLINWFGCVPDFMLTFDASYMDVCDDIDFCALVEHELCHCGQAIDEYGQPKFRKRDSKPIYCMKSHDVEEFVTIVRRYGAAAGAGETEALVHAAQFVPTIGRAKIENACGTCRLRMVA